MAARRLLNRLSHRSFCTHSVKDMNVIVDLCIVPMKNTNATSVSAEIAIIQKLIIESGLNHNLHAYGTNIEGPWDKVFDLVKECHSTLHFEYGIPRISTSIKCGTRIDKEQTIKEKISSVEEKL